MKLLTLNFLTCALKSCKTAPSSFPLHPRDSELEIIELDINLPFLKNILPRLMWEEIRTIAGELGLPSLPDQPPTPSDLATSSSTLPTPADPDDITTSDKPATAATEEAEETPTQTAIDLHRILLETTIKEGKLVCGNCGHEYAVKEGVANFLLPGHMV